MGTPCLKTQCNKYLVKTFEISRSGVIGVGTPAFMCFSHTCYCIFLYYGANIWGKIHHLSGQGVVVMGNV
jgi:hypothetical protein